MKNSYIICINYRNKLYRCYVIITGRLLKERHRLVNDEILFKCKEDEIYSVAAALDSMGYNRRI